MSTSFEQRKRAIWIKLQRELGFNASPELKSAVDKEAGPVLVSEDLDSYEGTVRSMLGIARIQAVSQYLNFHRFVRAKRRNDANRKIYPRPLQRRTYLVSFVIKHQLLIKVRKNSSSRRFNWRKICKIWNDAHPHYNMSPLVLKATYYRAAADGTVIELMMLNQLERCEKIFHDTLYKGEKSAELTYNLALLFNIPIENMSDSFQLQYNSLLKTISPLLERVYGNKKKINITNSSPTEIMS